MQQKKSSFFIQWINVVSAAMAAFGGIIELCHPVSESLMRFGYGFFAGGLLMWGASSLILAGNAISESRKTKKKTEALKEAKEAVEKQFEADRMVCAILSKRRGLITDLRSAALRHQNAEALLQQAAKDVDELDRFEDAVGELKKYATSKALIPLLTSSLEELAKGLHQNSSDILVVCSSSACQNGDLPPDALDAIRRELSSNKELIGIFSQMLKKAGQSSIQSEENDPFSGIGLKSGLTAVEYYTTTNVR